MALLDSVPDFKKKSFKEITHEGLLYEYYENPYIRGKSSILFGEQGCGKSTAICRICEKYHEQSDYTIWRLRSNDNIHRIKDFEKKCVFWFATTDSPNISLVKGSDVVDIFGSLDIRYYKNTIDLMENMVKGKINAIMPPSEFFFSRDIALPKMIAKKEKNESNYGKTLKYLSEYPMKSTYLWFEILYWLVEIRETNERVTMIWDEADEILEATPKAHDWTILAWGKDVFNDVRKSNVNVVLVTHQKSDIHYLYRDNCSYRIYMKGCLPLRESPVKAAPKQRFIGLLENKIEFTPVKFNPFPPERMAGDLKIRITYEGSEANEKVKYMKEKLYLNEKKTLDVFDKWKLDLTAEEKYNSEMAENELKMADEIYGKKQVTLDSKSKKKINPKKYEQPDLKRIFSK